LIAQFPSGAEAILHVVERFQALGYRESQHGVRLFGPVPHVAPQAWLHAIPRGLTDLQIGELSRAVGKVFPAEYVEFLREINGSKLFAGALYLYGMRPAAAGRTVDSAFLPFDIVDPNRLESPPGLRRELLLIGGYKVDGSQLVIDVVTGSVERISRESGARLNAWLSLREFLTDEMLRLDSLHDSSGRLTTTRDLLLPAPDQ
jgi:hypothetical protein